MKPVLLDTLYDVNGETLEIYFSNQLRGTPAMIELLKANVELLEHNHAGIASIVIRDDDRVVWAQTTEGNIRSSIAYATSTDAYNNTIGGSVMITLTYTDPNFRDKGLRTLLQPYIEQVILNEGCNLILSYVHVNNASPNAVVQKQGFIKHSTIYYKRLKN
jgi:predicted GNAT family acetyltransferase